MLRILRVVPFFAPAFGHGGPVVHSFNLSKAQIKLGHHVRVFTTNIYNYRVASKELPKFEIVDKVHIHRFPIFFRLGQSHFFITPSLASGFLKYNYDVLHVHSYRTFQTNIATIINKFHKKPFIFTAHGTLRNMYLLRLFLTKNKEANRMRYFDFVFKNFFLNTVDRVIVHSNHEKWWTLKFNVPEEMIRIVPHGINVENFTNPEHKVNFIKKYKPKGKVILYVGRLFRNYRQLDYLIESMKIISQEYEDAKLWIVGHVYDKDYELELRKLVNTNNLIKNVKFITNPTREDIFGAYQVASVFVFPITESDSFGIPLIEAGASKTPVISTNRGPAPELIIDGKNGFLINKDDEYQLTDKLLKILDNEKLEKEMGMKGYEIVLRNYTWDAVAKQTDEIYKELI